MAHLRASVLGNEERVRSTVAFKLAVTDSKQQLPRDRRDGHCCTRPERGGEAYTRGKSRRQEGRRESLL